MGKGNNPLAPLNKMVGNLDPTTRNIHKYDKKDNKR